MKRYFTQEEINKAKTDKSIRDKIKAEIEEKAEKGKPIACAVEGGTARSISVRVATEDAIRHYCNSIGDVNPLYRSRDYARKSVHGGLIAPPHFICAVSYLTGVALGGMNNLDFFTGQYEAGIQVEWFKTIREDDSFTAFEVFTEAIDLTREHTQLMFLVRGNRVYKNQRDEVVAIVNGSMMAIIQPSPTEVGGGGPLKKDVKVHKFSEEEVEDWYQKTINEPIRGAEPRFWEDVKVGDELPPGHHVFTMMENMAFMCGVGSGNKNWRLQMGAPDANYGPWRKRRDPESGLPDFTNQHLTDAAAQLLGGPRANAAGVNMKLWLGQLVTNWMGDAGFLKKIVDQVRSPLYRESLALLKGQVAKKYIEGDEHLVDIDITLEDHDGVLVIPKCLATVVLPSRQMENWWPSATSRPPF